MFKMFSKILRFVTCAKKILLPFLIISVVYQYRNLPNANELSVFSKYCKIK